MNDDIRSAARELKEALGTHFEIRKVYTTGTVVGIEKDPIGVVRNVTVSVGGAEGIVVPYRLNEPVVEGEDLDLARTSNMVNAQYTVLGKSTSTLVESNEVLPVDSPTVVVDGIVNLPEDSGPGGYRAKAAIRYQLLRRGGYDLFNQGWSRIVFRFRRAGDEQSWAQSAPVVPVPSQFTSVVLLGAILAGATSLTIAAGLEIPANPNALAGGEIRLLVGNEIVSGNYNSTTGIVSGLTRGIEPVAGDTTTLASSHADGSPVVVLTGQVTIPDLPTGVDHYVQIAPARPNGVFGVWVPASPISFTSWEQTQPPANVDGSKLIVESREAVYDVRWARVLLDAAGKNMYDLKGYKVYRSANPTTATGWTTTRTVSGNPAAGYSTGLPGDAVSFADTGSGAERIVPQNSLGWPATRGSGYFFGVQAFRDAGGLGSARIVWESDTIPPPAPNVSNVTLTPVNGGIDVDIAESDTSMSDPGFKEYVLYRNATPVAAGATIVHRWRSRHDTYPMPDLTGYYFQVSSGDWAGNVDTANLSTAGYWQFMRALYAGTLPDLQFPANGNFDSVDPKASPAWPLYWEYPATIVGTGLTCTFNTSGGVYGTKKMDIFLPAGKGVSDYVSLVSKPFPFNPTRDINLSFLHKESSSGGTAVGYKMSLLLYASEDGTGTPVPYTVLGSPSFVPSTTWRQDNDGNTADATNIGYHSARLVLSIAATVAGTRAASVTVSIDNVRMAYA